MESEIKEEFGLNGIDIKIVYPQPATKAERGGKKTRKHGEVIMGSPIRDKNLPDERIFQASGKITVRGEVFAADSRSFPSRTPGRFPFT